MQTSVSDPYKGCCRAVPCAQTASHGCAYMQVLIVESYGGRDEPVDTLTNNFVGVGVEPVLEPVRVKEVPNEATYQVSALQLLLLLSL